MPPRNRTTAEAQLGRILYILPAAARREGVRIDELARALDVDAATILDDLETAAARIYYHPAGAVESFTITTDGETVQVYAPHEFNRPVRLDPREALALGLGLRALAADAEQPRRHEIVALAARLEAELSAPRGTGSAHAARARAESEVEYEEYALALGFDDDGFRSVVADAVQLQRCCTILYLKPGDAAPAQRRIAPYRLIYAKGMWYVAASDLDRGALRYFRMDRVLDAVLQDEAVPPEPLELEEQLARGMPYRAIDDFEVVVRYSPKIARWIVERTPAYEPNGDGSVVVRHRVADPRWIVRHVLQYGGEAVVEEPDEVRRWVTAAARAIVDGLE